MRKEKALPQELAARVELDPAALARPLDLAAAFGNSNPVELEVGTGKGRFLLGQAAARPEVNFLGIEVASRYYRLARDRAAKRGLRNCRLLRTDAYYAFSDLLSDASLQAVYCFHPDPWPKKRHWKRRLFQPAFVDLLARRLRPGGVVIAQTDHADYFAWIEDALRAEPRLVFDGAARDALPYGLTNFEIKYQAEGRPIFRTAYRRV